MLMEDLVNQFEGVPAIDLLAILSHIDQYTQILENDIYSLLEKIKDETDVNKLRDIANIVDGITRLRDVLKKSMQRACKNSMI